VAGGAAEVLPVSLNFSLPLRRTHPLHCYDTVCKVYECQKWDAHLSRRSCKTRASNCGNIGRHGIGSQSFFVGNYSAAEVTVCAKRTPQNT